MVSAKKEKLTWLVYLPVGIFLFYSLVVRFTSASFFSLDYGLFLVLAVLVSFFPIRTQETVFSLVSGVSLASFVIYGVLPELFLSSLALLALMIRSDIKWDQHYRYPLNLLMISMLSIVSAAAHTWFLDVISGTYIQSNRLFPLVVYTFVYLVSNQIILYFTNKFYYQREDVSLLNEHFLFALRTNVLTLPLSYILIYLYYQMGSLGILVGAVPFLAVTLGVNSTYRSRNNNSYLKKVNRASQRMTGKMNRKSVIKSFITSLLEIFPAERIYYFKVIDGNQVVLERVYAKDKTYEEVKIEMVLTNNSVLSRALERQLIATYSKAKDWKSIFAFDVDYHAESAMVLPIHILTQSRGIILMTHQKRSIFDEYIVSLVEVFYQYFITVLDNTHHYEKLEISNVTDYLTGLPNFRGFSNKLKSLVRKKEFASLSVIILDLDYFKQVNDIHGHEAGNDVLRQVAEVLKKYKTNDRYTARYGGEEFVLLLKNHGKEEAYELAEDIRKEIEGKSCVVKYSIATDLSANLSVTASFGVATYPDDSDDVYELISLADRTMYLGSKKNGRNRVTVFNKES